MSGIVYSNLKEKLQEYFGKFGKVSSVDLKKGKGKVSRFVFFHRKDMVLLYLNLQVQ